jgi:hypothetical protein
MFLLSAKKKAGRGKGRNVLASAVSHLFSIIPEITMQKNQQKTQQHKIKLK